MVVRPLIVASRKPEASSAKENVSLPAVPGTRIVRQRNCRRPPIASGATAAVENVVSGAAVECVISGATDQNVVALVAVDNAVGFEVVIASAAIEGDANRGFNWCLRHNSVIAVVALDGEAIESRIGTVDPHVVAQAGYFDDAATGLK